MYAKTIRSYLSPLLWAQVALGVLSLSVLPFVALGSGTVIDVTPDPLNFGIVSVGASSSSNVTISVTGCCGPLTVDGGTITDANSSDFEFTNCTDPVIPNGGSCTASVKFTPSAVGARSATLEVLSNADVQTDRFVTLSGTGRVVLTLPTLVFPADGASDLSTKLTLVWEESESSDGEDVTYTLFLCEDETFDGCDGTVIAASAGATGAIAMGLGGGAGLLMLGLWLPAFRTRRSSLVLLVAGCFVSAMMLAACSDSSGDGDDVQAGQVGEDVSDLEADTIYYWKVGVEDSDGLSVESDTFSFTTK